MQLLSPPTHNILCCYTNRTSRIQILRISDMPDRFFERSVMPQEIVLFEALSAAHLEIHTSEIVGAILSDVIPCSQLARSCDIRKQLEQLSTSSRRQKIDDFTSL